MTFSLVCRERFAPAEDPSIAKIIVGTARRRLTIRFRMKRTVASDVPQAEDSLFVAIALWIGSPANRYAGRDISPPPPPTASTKPARNNIGHTIKNAAGVRFTAILLFIRKKRRDMSAAHPSTQ